MSNTTPPSSVTPLGTYVPLKQHGDLLYTSGLLPIVNGQLLYTGTVGQTVSVEDAQAAAKQCVENALSLFEAHCGSLDKIDQMLSVTGYIQAANGFTQHPLVLNGASNTLVERLGERGQHVRTAIGVASLPLNSPVEISFIAKIKL